MKKLIYISVILLICKTTYSQTNLVPNGSFEQYTTCPNSWASFNSNVLNWTGLPWGTPDGYDTCGNAFQFGVPQNPYGFQYAEDGNSYSGIGFGLGGQVANFREYMQVKLTDTLIYNKKYFVSFFVSKADSAPIVNTKIGAHLSVTNTLSTLPNGVINETPQVVSPPNYYIQDDVNWIEVSDTIIAQGGELYITIGYFESDSTSDTLRLFHSTQSQILGLGNDAEWTAYYYFDNVKVICLDCLPNSITTINAGERPVIYPNPAVNTFNVKLSKPYKSIELLNSNGITVKSFITAECNVSDVEQGLYFLKITYLNQQISYQKIIITKN
jgi:hypothetical protein